MAIIYIPRLPPVLLKTCVDTKKISVPCKPIFAFLDMLIQGGGMNRYRNNEK